MTRDSQAEQAAFPNTFRQGWDTAVEIIGQHIPDLTEDALDVLAERTGGDNAMWMPADWADLAYRVCPCGVTIDGFYEYVDHLKEVLA
jgi:hypothetical protein